MNSVNIVGTLAERSYEVTPNGAPIYKGKVKVVEEYIDAQNQKKAMESTIEVAAFRKTATLVAAIETNKKVAIQGKIRNGKAFQDGRPGLPYVLVDSMVEL